jgi:hypothetical protein
MPKNSNGHGPDCPCDFCWTESVLPNITKAVAGLSRAGMSALQIERARGTTAIHVDFDGLPATEDAPATPIKVTLSGTKGAAEEFFATFVSFGDEEAIKADMETLERRPVFAMHNNIALSIPQADMTHKGGEHPEKVEPKLNPVAAATARYDRALAPVSHWVHADQRVAHELAAAAVALNLAQADVTHPVFLKAAADSALALLAEMQEECIKTRRRYAALVQAAKAWRLFTKAAPLRQSAERVALDAAIDALATLPPAADCLPPVSEAAHAAVIAERDALRERLTSLETAKHLADAAIGWLRRQLRIDRDVFSDYARQHRAKGTHEGDAKARANFDCVKQINQTLGMATSGATASLPMTKAEVAVIDAAKAWAAAYDDAHYMMKGQHHRVALKAAVKALAEESK